MYTVEGNDVVIPLEGVPQSCTGAPMPMLRADEGRLFVAYIVSTPPPADWDGFPVAVDLSKAQPVAVVEFVDAYSHMFGFPNDERLDGHPLWSRGLRSYGAFEVLDSSWIRALKRIQRTHLDLLFRDRRHFVLTFHDSMLECVAKALRARVVVGRLGEVLDEAWRLPGEGRP